MAIFKKLKERIEFNHSKNVFKDLNEKLASKPIYRKMLNNLLGIGNADNAVFSSSKVNNIDLEHILSKSDYKKIFSSKSFSVAIDDVKAGTMLSDLTHAKTFDEFIEIIEENGASLAMVDRKLLEADFDKNKDKVIAKQKKKKSQKISKWKRFKNRYLDQQVQSNSWPLYIGAMFVKVKTPSSAIYAPLILKKVEVRIAANNKVTIASIDDGVDLNEKAMFLLQNEYRFNIPEINPEKDYSLNDVIKKFKASFEDLISPDFDFEGKFDFIDKKAVENQNILYAKGALLTITSPSGGILRNKLIDLLKKTDLDDLLSFDMMQDFKSKIDDDLEKGAAVFRINQTDFSQEKAIIGALQDHAIIWGPPGTGKSQTITNVVANILFRGQTAIITSEKKAALDVIQKRMGKLGKYMYFGLTDKHVDKKAFYKPFNDLADMVSVEHTVTPKNPSKLITDHELNYLKQKQMFEGVDLDNMAFVKNIINTKYPNAEEKLIPNVKLLKKYDEIIKVVPQFDNVDEALASKDIVKKGLLWKRYKFSIRKLIKLMAQFQNDGEFLNHFNNIEDFAFFKNMDKYLAIEESYRVQRKDFDSDEDYLDAFLAAKFRKRILKMSENEAMDKKVKSFLKNCKSGFRIPYKFSKIHNEVLTKLFDIFVSTPQTLASLIDMYGSYDYVIFDEASQLHLEKAIPFLSLGKKAIVAGDNQQMRPTSYFGRRDKTEMIDDAEENVSSLLDFAYRKGMENREYMLTKNYRSKAAELMMFSSKEFYKGNLDVIDNKEHIGSQAIEVIDAKGKWEGRVNAIEAEMMLDKLMKEKDNFEKIILLTLNSTQRQYVESLIYNGDKYSVVVDLLKDEKVFLRNLENIQGDEADLVIVSVGYDKSASLGATYVAKPEGKNALNVAVSRAVEKMIVFKSISAAEVKGNVKNDSIRVFREWLSYLEMPSDQRKVFGLFKEDEEGTDTTTEEVVETQATFTSEFEESVYNELSEALDLPANVSLETNFAVGSYSIDMVLINTKSKKFLLGVEVDGYKSDSKFKTMIKEIERQTFIKSRQYDPIYRVTELNWKVNKAKVINEIKALLKKEL